VAGIYIHIPFCKQACYYCNFHFSTLHNNMPEMLDAIIKEASMQKNYLTEKIETIYFGGGTPSIYSVLDIKKIIEHLNQIFSIVEDVEITLEANPDDISEEKLIQWKEIGINRLSIGIQSFVEEDLKWMNRAHNSFQALNCLQLATEYFNNITVDLIYGTPYLTNEQWKKNIDTVVQLNIPHISCYALTVEPKTVLHTLIQKNKLPNINVEQQAQHFEILTNTLSKAHYEHYEISNFAKTGFRSKHNSSYWQGKHYLGLGPSAHSFNGISRQWNNSNNTLYLKSIAQNIVPFEIEILTTQQQLNEYIMTSLRTIEGISLQHITKNFSEEEKEKLLSRSKKLITQQLLSIENNYLKLTPQAKFLADGIAADLFVDC
jgi:oxygen-independent coproporphyrinogen-3 oxidase